MSNKRCKVESKEYELKTSFGLVDTHGLPEFRMPYLRHISGSYVLQVLYNETEEVCVCIEEFGACDIVFSRPRERYGYLNLKCENVTADFSDLDYTYTNISVIVKWDALAYRLIDDSSMTIKEYDNVLFDIRNVLSVYLSKHVDQIVVDYISRWVIRS